MRQAKGRVCAHPTSDAGKRLEWPVSKAKNRLHLGEGREVCRYFHHALDAGGGGVVRMATIASRDRFQAQSIWEMSANSIDADVFRALLTPSGKEVVKHSGIK